MSSFRRFFESFQSSETRQGTCRRNTLIIYRHQTPFTRGPGPFKTFKWALTSPIRKRKHREFQFFVQFLGIFQTRARILFSVSILIICNVVIRISTNFFCHTKVRWNIRSKRILCLRARRCELFPIKSSLCTRHHVFLVFPDFLGNNYDWSVSCCCRQKIYTSSNLMEVKNVAKRNVLSSASSLEGTIVSPLRFLQKCYHCYE